MTVMRIYHINARETKKLNYNVDLKLDVILL